jgi:hypothetical protein
MLFALGAAATALDAVSALSSSGGSSSGASSSPSTGFSAVDPFEIASPVSASSSAAASGSGAASQISPATLNTLIAAQGQSSTGSTGAADSWQDLASQVDGDAGSGDSAATASSYNSLAQMFQQQMNAVSFSAPPMSISV